VLLSRPASVIETRQPVVVEGNTYYKSDWMETGRDPAFAPTTFLVEQQPHVSLRTHFHRSDQFQLFLAGRGAIGRHPIESVMVHFATGYSAYGPIVAGPTGLTWLTLRTVFESGSLTMKDHADQMRRVPKRQFHSASVQPSAIPSQAESHPILPQPESHPIPPRAEHHLIPPQPDGLFASVVSLGPDGVAAMPAPAPSAGQFRVVLAGSLRVDGRVLLPWEHCFIEPDEAVQLEAGPGGAQVVILQFPHKAHGAEPARSSPDQAADHAGL
jgi:hypothetical protein